MHFIKFEIPNSSDFVYVNRSAIRAVSSSADALHAVLIFDWEHRILVSGAPATVAQKLED